MPSFTTIIDERFPALNQYDYRRLFINGFFTYGARWADILARGWLVFELSGNSATAVGWVAFASFLPAIVVGPIAGVLADHIDRRNVLIFGTLGGVIFTLLQVVVIVTDVVQVWHVILLGFLSGAAQSTTIAARQSLIANVVKKEQLMNAVALTALARHGSRIFGPLIGTVLLTTVGAAPVFILSTLLLLIGLIELIRMNYRMDPEAENKLSHGVSVGAVVSNVSNELLSGVQYIRNDNRILTIVWLVAAHCGLTMSIDALLPTRVTDLNGEEDLFGLALIAIGVGSVVGTIIISQLSNDSQRAWTFRVMAVGSGIGPIVLGSSGTATIFIIGALIAGFTQSAFMAMTSTFVQEVVSDEFRGRVLSLYIMLAGGTMAFLNLGFGRVTDLFDVRAVFILPAVLWLIIIAVAVFKSSEFKSLIRHGRFVSNDEKVLT